MILFNKALAMMANSLLPAAKSYLHLLWLMVMSCILCSISVVSADEEIQADHIRISWLAPDKFASDPASENATLAIYMEPETGWHVYWKNPGDSGAAPKFQFQTTNVTLGDVAFPYPIRLPVEHLVNLGYPDKTGYLLKASVEPLAIRSKSENRSQVTIQVELEWLVCKEECVPGFGTLTLTRPIGGTHHQWDPNVLAELKPLKAKIPKPAAHSPLAIHAAYWSPPNGLTLSFSSQNHEFLEPSAYEFYSADTGVLSPKAPQVSLDGKTMDVYFEAESGVLLPERGNFVLVVNNQQAFEFNGIEIAPSSPLEPDYVSFLWLLISAFIGGIILNAMPCVFPVLSIKLFSLIQKNNQQGTIRKLLYEGLAYSLGVLVAFTVLGGLFLVLRQAGAMIGWGFQLQSPYIVFALVLLFWLLALNFLGFFEWGYRLQRLAGAGDRSAFFTGLLAVVVAAPCTGPFLGAALGAASILPSYTAFSLFVALGLGFALPFLLLSGLPSLQRLLPKPGPWMVRLKEFFAFPLFATVLWLVWVLSELSSNHAWTVVGIVLLLISFSLWLIQNSYFISRLIAGLLIVTAIIYGFLNIKQQPVNSYRASSEQWQHFDEAVFVEARREGRAIFIDFTAAWCITCQVNKKRVLDTAATMELFSLHKVVTLRADWTRYDPMISKALADLGRNSVPVYAYYPEAGGAPRLLPQILSQQDIQQLFTSDQ